MTCYDFFEIISRFCPIAEIVLFIISIVQFSGRYQDALDYRGDSYKVQEMPKDDNKYLQIYNYYIIKENAIITQIDFSKCHTYSSHTDASLDRDFVHYFSTHSYDSGQQPNDIYLLAVFYYLLFALQLLGLLVSVIFKLRRIKVDESQEAVLKFAEYSSALVNYYFGTLLIPILSIDYSTDCVSSYFTYLSGLSPFVPYWGSIAIIVLGFYFLGLCCHYNVSNPPFIFTSLCCLMLSCGGGGCSGKDSDSSDGKGGSIVALIFLAIVLLIVFYPTISGFKNNEIQITVVCIINFSFTVLSGVKEWFRGKFFNSY